MRGLQVWSEGRKRRVGAALKGLPWVARGGKHEQGAAAAAQRWVWGQRAKETVSEGAQLGKQSTAVNLNALIGETEEAGGE